MRFSLKELFVLVIYFAFLARCIAWVGLTNYLFWVSLVVSLVLSTLVIGAAVTEKMRWLAPLFPVPCFVCCALPGGSLSLLVNSLFLCSVGVFVTLRPRLHVKTLIAIAMIGSTLSLAVGLIPGFYRARSLIALQRTYPVVSLKNRLQYEQRNQASRSSATFELSAPAAAAFHEFERDVERTNDRMLALRWLHDEQHEAFVRAVGFGVTRMSLPSIQRIGRPGLTDIPFEENDDAESGRELKHGDWNAYRHGGESDNAEYLHKLSRLDFLDSDGFGVVFNSVAKVAGFIEHGFHYSPVIGLKDREAWRIERLELVSLLKFDEPRVYVLDHLPRMDQLATRAVPTRPLDSFESNALQQLRTETDVVVSDTNDVVRMLGSLRATKQCLDCHHVDRGELLGAFSYVLRGR